ncbi:hypothetical protein MG293_000882 [Ovis ammon polii]|uniref:Uncharacterized protein n=1 Tax=Ovis ammon polii TaxID=230172 RepID=A0AAD4UL50_OVIAM|nr:hypothetical protein MG293_000882 [Ovis ammon polii]
MGSRAVPVHPQFSIKLQFTSQDPVQVVLHKSSPSLSSAAICYSIFSFIAKPTSLPFSKQNVWYQNHSGISNIFPEESRVRLCDPMDHNPPGSSVHGGAPGNMMLVERVKDLEVKRTRRMIPHSLCSYNQSRKKWYMRISIKYLTSYSDVLSKKDKTFLFSTEKTNRMNCEIPENRKLSLRTSLLGATAAAAKSLQSCPTLYDSIDSSPPGSPVPGILQARTLEWVAISFSNA